VSGGLTARLKSPLTERADFSEVLVDSWTSLSAKAMAERPVYLEREGPILLGDLFEIAGTADGSIRFAGDLKWVNRLGAGLGAGEVTVEGNVGMEAGLGMSGGALIVEKNAGARAGAAALGHKLGMTGGELVVKGSAGPEAGAAMRRGLLVVGRDAGDRTGLGMIAGNVIVFGKAGIETGLWSKRGSVVALGPITPPATYVYACTYQPIHLRLMLTRLRVRYGLSIQRRHLTGLYRRYSGDLAELAKGEILEWVSK
jgi:formylmethanofuran dehydrogenase subunit C